MENICSASESPPLTHPQPDSSSFSILTGKKNLPSFLCSLPFLEDGMVFTKDYQVRLRELSLLNASPPHPQMFTWQTIVFHIKICLFVSKNFPKHFRLVWLFVLMLKLYCHPQLIVIRCFFSREAGVFLVLFCFVFNMVSLKLKGREECSLLKLITQFKSPSLSSKVKGSGLNGLLQWSYQKCLSLV